MAFSSRRRNYLLTPHRKDGLIDWMKSMLNHSFVLDALDTTAADTFSHFEMLIEEHRENEVNGNGNGGSAPSRLKQLVPTVGTFHTNLPLRSAFVAYNKKYALTKRKFITISFNELRHILNLAQIMAIRANSAGENNANASSTGQDGEKSDECNGKREEDSISFRESLKNWENSPGYLKQENFLPDPKATFLPPMSLGKAAEVKSDDVEKTTTIAPSLGGMYSMDGCSFKGPKMITFDGDQTLYSDGANFEGNPELANYLYLLLRQGVTLAVVTAAGYEYHREKYETRLSGLLAFFKSKELPAEDCERFYLFGGECNFLLKLGSDYRLHPVKEFGAGGWKTATKYIDEAPGNWNEGKIQSVLDVAQECVENSITELKIRGRCIRKKRAVGLIAKDGYAIPREALDETVLRVQEKLDKHSSVTLPFCAFNGGSDVWCDVGNKRVGVHILASYLGMPPEQTIHVGDQFLNTGNDYAARDICPCIWITNPDETTYILKSILRLAGVPLEESTTFRKDSGGEEVSEEENNHGAEKTINFSTMMQRHSMTMLDKIAPAS